MMMMKIGVLGLDCQNVIARPSALLTIVFRDEFDKQIPWKWERAVVRGPVSAAGVERDTWIASTSDCTLCVSKVCNKSNAPRLLYLKNASALCTSSMVHWRATCCSRMYRMP